MCGVIVVDAESFRSTYHGRDAYIHDHCLKYHNNYVLFYQLLSSNFFTHRMFLSREKPLVKPMAPGPFLSYYFQIYKTKNPKIPCCNLFIFILFYTSIYLLYLSLSDLIIASNREGNDNPFIMLGASIFLFA